MKSFLSAVAAHILENEGDGIGDCCFVFPNRRAALVFKNELIKQAVHPFWSPEMTSVDDWLARLAGKREAGKIQQLLSLYQAVSKKTDKGESLDNFIRWGEMLLRDFDETDKYLVDPELLFSSVKSLREIEMQFPSLSQDELDQLNKFWKGFHPTPSSYQKNWLALWQSLAGIYHEFNSILVDQGLATSGNIYRIAARKVEEDPIASLPLRKYYFIGFNALTRAEERIFETCRIEGKALFYWDIPVNLLESYHESGRFIRANMKKFPSPASFDPSEPGIGDRFKKPFPGGFESINIFACESASGQVSVLRQLLTEGKPGANVLGGGQKAVVLADESLLEIVLSGIASPDLGVNISMGYPAGRSMIADFVRRLVELNVQLNSRIEGLLFLPAKKLKELIRHPLLKGVAKIDSGRGEQFLEDWPASMIPLSLLLENAPWFEDLLSFRESSKLPAMLTAILEKLGEDTSWENALELGSFELIRQWLGEVSLELSSRKLKISFDSFRLLFDDFIQRERLPFEGRLDAEIQLTGVLETRLMDYDELIVLSCNEGVWPADSSSASLIPYSLRKAYGLPVREFSDSFYGYYFYRLLQRAAKVTLMYVNSPDPSKMSLGDPSRFIQQLRYDSDQHCNEFLVASAINPGIRTERSVKKSGAIYDSLQRYIDPAHGKMLSPSALNSYIDCPLRFAMQYLLGIREGDELSQAGEPRMFGILMHKTMENIYREFLLSGAPVSREYLYGLIKDEPGIGKFIRDAFMSEYFKMPADQKWPGLYGKDILVHDVIRKQVTSVLMVDAGYAPFRVTGLEKKVRAGFSFNMEGREHSVMLGGYIDRIDEKDGVIRILDYKSGNPEMKFREVGELFDSGKVKRPGEILQASLYCLIVLEGNTEVKKVMPVLYPTGKMRGSSFNPGIIVGGQLLSDIEQVKDDVADGLRAVLAEMFNPGIDFYQTVNEANCKYCPFNDYCGR